MVANKNYFFQFCIFVQCIAGFPAVYAGSEPAPLTPQREKQPLTSGVKSLSAEELQQERLRQKIKNKPKAYVDRVIEPDTNSVTVEDGDTQSTSKKNDTNGLRQYVVQTKVRWQESEQSSGGLVNGVATRQRSLQWGMGSELRWQTLNYGEFIAQADVYHDHRNPPQQLDDTGVRASDAGQRITLQNRAFPVVAGVFSDVSLGDINSEVTYGLTRSSRLSLGRNALRGVAVRLYGNGWDVRAGSGSLTRARGELYSGYRPQRGSTAWLGATRVLGDNWYVAAQFSRAEDVPAFANLSSFYRATGSGVATQATSAQSLRQDNNAAVFAVAHKNTVLNVARLDIKLSYAISTSRLRNGVNNASNNNATQLAQELRKLSASGVFFNSQLRFRRYSHEWGWYFAKPGLVFGANAVQSDSKGVYWRTNFAGRHLSAGLMLDAEQRNPYRQLGRAHTLRKSVYVYADYRLNSRKRFGGGVRLSATTGRNLSLARGSLANALNVIRRNEWWLNVYLDHRFITWGKSRFGLTTYRNRDVVASTTNSGYELRWEHDWVVKRYETMRPEFTTLVGYSADTSAGGTVYKPVLGLRVRHWASALWSVGGELRYSASNGQLRDSHGWNGNAYAERQLSKGWSMGVRANVQNQNTSFARVDNVGGVNSTRLTAATSSIYNNKSVYAYLRWQATEGGLSKPIGKLAGYAQGSGGLKGVVYYDADRSGDRQLDEKGVAGVEVLLDGAYRTTTNRLGEYEFPLVSTGEHRLTLDLDTVPLPWTAGQREPTVVNVFLRSMKTVDLPVVQIAP